MHDTERQAAIRRCLQRLRTAETAHIIQETRTAPCRLRHHAGRARIHRNDRIAVLSKRLHSGDNPVQLLCLADSSGARTGRLTADIENISTFGQHFLGAGQKHIGIDAPIAVKLSAIGKGVWGNVENTHDARMAKVQPARTTSDGVDHLRETAAQQ